MGGLPMLPSGIVLLPALEADGRVSFLSDQIKNPRKKAASGNKIQPMHKNLSSRLGRQILIKRPRGIILLFGHCRSFH